MPIFAYPKSYFSGSESAESIHTESIDKGKYSKAQSLTGIFNATFSKTKKQQTQLYLLV